MHHIDIALVRVGADFPDGAFGGLDSQRCVLANQLRIGQYLGIELRHIHHPIDIAHAHGLGAIELAGREKDVRRIGRAHQIDEALHADIVVAQTHACGRHAEHRIRGGNADVAGSGNAHATAHADAADLGNDRLGTTRRRGVGQLDRRVIDRLCISGAALLFELRDVSAGDKGLLAIARQHDDIDLRIRLEIIKGLGQSLPHVETHGVVLRHVGKNDPADGTFFFDDQFSHVAFLRLHVVNTV